jgi:hypothetical protein
LPVEAIEGAWPPGSAKPAAKVTAQDVRPEPPDIQLGARRRPMQLLPGDAADHGFEVAEHGNKQVSGVPGGCGRVYG